MLNMVFVAFLVGVALMLIPGEKSQPLLNLFESLDAVIIRIVEMVDRLCSARGVRIDCRYRDERSRRRPEEYRATSRSPRALQLHGNTGHGRPRVGNVSAPASHVNATAVASFFPWCRACAVGCVFDLIERRSSARYHEDRSAKSRCIGGGGVVCLAAGRNDPTWIGTALYQAVAAVFIAQTLGIPVDLGAQVTIVFMALLASIGTAAVPSAGVVMLVIILEAIGVPVQGIALILGVDRILDMCRTAANVTGDTTVAVVIAASENQLFPTLLNKVGGVGDLPGGTSPPGSGASSS